MANINPFDQFDSPSNGIGVSQQQTNPFDQFDVQQPAIQQNMTQSQIANLTPQQKQQIYQSDVPTVDASGNIIKQPPAPEPSLGQKAIGAGEAALSTATGATTGTVAHILGTTFALYDRLANALRNGETDPQKAADLVEQQAANFANQYVYQPRTKVGQEYAQNIGEVAQQLQPLTGISSELNTIGQATKGLGQEVSAIRNLPNVSKIKDLSAIATDKQIPVIKTVQAVKSALTPEYKKLLINHIENKPLDPEFVPYKLAGNTVVTDKPAIAAAKQGWEPGFVQVIKNSSPADLNSYKNMINNYIQGKKNMELGQQIRPADVVGQTFSNRINKLFQVKKDAIEKLDKSAENLKNTKIDYAQPINNFEQKLKDMGITIDKGEGNIINPNMNLGEPDIHAGKIRVWLKNSNLEGDQASKRLLKNVFERLGNTNVKSGYDLHRAKRWLDTQVEMGKKSPNGLLNETEYAVKGLRHDINQTLGDNSQAYRNANIQYKDSLDSLEEIQKAVGRTKDLTGQNADKMLGQEARKLLTNYGNRVNMMDSIYNADNILQKYGHGVKGNMLRQIIFANELDHMFGAVARGSFQAKIRDANVTGLETAQQLHSKSLAQMGMELANTAVKKARGINEKNALKSIQELINSQKR